MSPIIERMQRLLEMPHLELHSLDGGKEITADFRIERYPLSRAERDALMAAFRKRGVVAQDGFEKFIYISPDGDMRPATEKEKKELLHLPEYWRKYMVTEGVADVVVLLNQAFASEWLAYYQYTLGAAQAKGPLATETAKELRQHADEEKQHADWLVKRILELGGKPLLDPHEWFIQSPCAFEAPNDHKVGVLLDQNIAGERCAISFYRRIMDMTRGVDEVTFKLVEKILAKEVEHEADLLKLKAKL